MTITEQNKILEDKIKANTLNFNLNRQCAIVSGFADGNFGKYEYLMQNDLALKPNSLQRARFQYSPLGNLLSKKLKVDDDDKKDDECYQIQRDRIDTPSTFVESSLTHVSTPAEELSPSVTETNKELSKLDELLKGLRHNEVFFKDFKTNIDNIDIEEANKENNKN